MQFKKFMEEMELQDEFILEQKMQTSRVICKDSIFYESSKTACIKPCCYSFVVSPLYLLKEKQSYCT